MTVTTTTGTLGFGLFMQPVHHPAEHPTLALERDLELIEWVDRLGFDEVWVGEHHSTGWETIAAPDIFIAVAAARTRHITLGTGIVPLPIHHPLHVADRAVLLDHLTRGRFKLGVGSGGGLPSDHHVFGLDNERARARLEPALTTIVRLLTATEPVTDTTDWYALHDAVLQLRPYTRPHMPLAIATGGPEGLRMVGRFGAQLLTGGSPERVPGMLETMREGASAAGRSVSREQIWLSADMHLAESREDAIRQIRDGAARERFDFFSGVNGAPAPEVGRDEYAETLARGGALVGTPDDAISAIERMLEQSGGFGGILFRVNEWASREARLHSYELFARYVMPSFQGSLLGPATAAEVASRVNHAREEVTA